MAIIDSQINLVNLEFSGDTESANKDTNNLFIDILKAVKDGQKQTDELSENIPNTVTEKSASQSNTTDVQVIAESVSSEEQATPDFEAEPFSEQAIAGNTNSLTDSQHAIEQQHNNTVVGHNNELATSQGALQSTLQGTLQHTLQSQEKAANTLLSKLSKSQSYTVSLNPSEPSKMSDVSANDNQQPVSLNASLNALRKELSQLVEQQGDSDLTIQQIKPVMQKIGTVVIQGESQLNGLGNQPKSEALARFIKDDLKPLLIKLSQIGGQNQEKENLNNAAPQIDGSVLNKDAQSKVSYLSQQVLPKVNQQALISPDTNKLDTSDVQSISDVQAVSGAKDGSNTGKGQIKNTAITSVANDMPKISKADLTPLLKKIDTIIEVDRHVSKQENISTVTSQLQSNELSKSGIKAIQINTTDLQESSDGLSSNNVRDKVRLHPHTFEQTAVNAATPKQKNNQNAVPDITRVSNLNTFEKLNVQDVDSGSESEQFEQPISFSKLLGTMRNNASTPVLSQLMTQVQSAQLQQTDLVNFEQQQMTQQVTQLTRHNNQTHVPTEQGLQNSINVARSEVTKALFDKANMMLNLNLKEAEIRLDPPELGSMQIRLRSDAEQAQINFIVQNQAAKEVLEQTMSKLKEMLAEQGIDLGESSVSEHGSENEQQASDNSQELSSKLEKESQNSTNAQIVNNKQDGIDFYA